MIKAIGYLLSAIGLACLAIVALPLALALGIVLLVFACIGAGSGLAIIGAFIIVTVVICALLLHALLPLVVPVLIVCGIVYLVKGFGNKRTTPAPEQAN